LRMFRILFLFPRLLFNKSCASSIGAWIFFTYPRL